MFFNKAIASVGVGLVLLASSTVQASQRQYQIEVTNITQAQTFTPILVTTHRRSVDLFELGTPASTELEMLAEGGQTAPLVTMLEAEGNAVRDIATGEGLLAPGESTTFTVSGNPRRHVLSIASMLIPTNDAFFAIDSVRLPRFGTFQYFGRAYDAGTEANDQVCTNIPGPRCGGEGFNGTPSAGQEGFVHVSNGFHDLGSVDANGGEILPPATYDWRNPVVRIRVTRVR